MADFTRASITYFHNPGPKNTEELARIVAERLKGGDIEAVVTATTSGNTALQIARALPKGTRVYAVNFQQAYWDRHARPKPEIQRQAEELGVVFMPDEPSAKYLRDIQGHSPDSLRRLGQGVKVAIEVVMQAVEVGHVKTGARVIGVGGSSKGADVALVISAAGPNELSRLWVSEILAKPK
ncbi:MAG TPA: pyruvate kinase alpha/beta domain-containing protein [Spirochaetia bacterium]|nr:pyruvate kinase alpha/beta domain-containing protein [Spirochaetia bacterium]